MGVLICKISKKGLVKITFENLELKIEPKNNVLYIDEENVSVYIDNVKQETFGENFIGHKYCAEEVLEGIVVDYLNNNTSIEMIEVPDRIRKFKESFFEPTGIVIAGRDVPKKIVQHGFGGNVLTLNYASDGFSEAYKAENPGYPKDYNGITAYADADGDYFTLLDAEGNVVTDIEAFYESGISEMWEKDNIVFGKEELAEIAKSW